MLLVVILQEGGMPGIFFNLRKKAVQEKQLKERLVNQ